jgi:hypothetical protein
MGKTPKLQEVYLLQGGTVFRTVWYEQKFIASGSIESIGPVD